MGTTALSEAFFEKKNQSNKQSSIFYFPFDKTVVERQSQNAHVTRYRLTQKLGGLCHKLDHHEYYIYELTEAGDQ